MIKRFLYALECFFYAWRNYHPKREVPITFESWMAKVTPFAVGDYSYINGREPTKGKVLPDGIEPFMMKKRCINEDGAIRYFDVVPIGWHHVDAFNLTGDC